MPFKVDHTEQFARKQTQTDSESGLKAYDFDVVLRCLNTHPGMSGSGESSTWMDIDESEMLAKSSGPIAGN